VSHLCSPIFMLVSHPCPTNSWTATFVPLSLRYANTSCLIGSLSVARYYYYTTLTTRFK
jgi:hypothetical protein